TEMTKVAEDYGGTVEKNTGDGLMAYFEDGGGTPPGTGPQRAVSSALTMFAANEHLVKPILQASSIEPIQFRISIDYGWVTVAKLGAPRRFNAYVAIGTTANFAAKMLQHAEPGELVIGDAVRNGLPPTWQVLWTKLKPEPSGWIYTATQLPYN